MSKTREQKKEIVQRLKDNFLRSKSVIFAGFGALPVNDANILRTTCSKEDVEYMVAKKTLINIAAKEANITLNAKKFEGQIAVTFGLKDEVAPAKVLHNFSKGREVFSILGGMLSGKEISKESAIALAKLPSREELLSKAVGALNAPISGLVNTLAGTMRGFAQVLSQIAESKK